MVNTTCPVEHAPRDPVPFYSNGDVKFKLHDVGWIVSGFFALVATVASFWLILKHLTYYTCPLQQRHIVRMLFMVPIYAIVSWLSYLFYQEAIYYQTIRDCYEAVVITSFFYLLLQYVGDTPAAQHDVFRRVRLEKWFFPLGFWKYRPSGLHFLWLMKICILQYAIIRPVCTLAAVILQYYGLYCLDSWAPYFGHIWLSATISISVSVAMYCLIQFYLPVRAELAPYAPVLKFLAVKSVVFLTFWQDAFLSMLASFGVIKPAAYMTADEIQAGIDALLETFEMACFAFLHIKAFTYLIYRPEDRIQKTSRWRALLDVLDFRDWARQMRESTRYVYAKSRGRAQDGLVRTRVEEIRAEKHRHLAQALGKERAMAGSGGGGDGAYEGEDVAVPWRRGVVVPEETDAQRDEGLSHEDAYIPTHATYLPALGSGGVYHSVSVDPHDHDEDHTGDYAFQHSDARTSTWQHQGEDAEAEAEAEADVERRSVKVRPYLSVSGSPSVHAHAHAREQAQARAGIGAWWRSFMERISNGSQQDESERREGTGAGAEWGIGIVPGEEGEMEHLEKERALSDGGEEEEEEGEKYPLSPTQCFDEKYPVSHTHPLPSTHRSSGSAPDSASASVLRARDSPLNEFIAAASRRSTLETLDTRGESTEADKDEGTEWADLEGARPRLRTSGSSQPYPALSLPRSRERSNVPAGAGALPRPPMLDGTPASPPPPPPPPVQRLQAEQHLVLNPQRSAPASERASISGYATTAPTTIAGSGSGSGSGSSTPRSTSAPHWGLRLPHFLPLPGAPKPTPTPRSDPRDRFVEPAPRDHVTPLSPAPRGSPARVTVPRPQQQQQQREPADPRASISAPLSSPLSFVPSLHSSERAGAGAGEHPPAPAAQPRTRSSVGPSGRAIQITIPDPLSPARYPYGAEGAFGGAGGFTVSPTEMTGPPSRHDCPAPAPAQAVHPSGQEGGARGHGHASRMTIGAGPQSARQAAAQVQVPTQGQTQSPTPTQTPTHTVRSRPPAHAHAHAHARARRSEPPPALLPGTTSPASPTPPPPLPAPSLLGHVSLPEAYRDPVLQVQVQARAQAPRSSAGMGMQSRPAVAVAVGASSRVGGAEGERRSAPSLSFSPGEIVPPGARLSAGYGPSPLVAAGPGVGCAYGGGYSAAGPYAHAQQQAPTRPRYSLPLPVQPQPQSQSQSQAPHAYAYAPTHAAAPAQPLPPHTVGSYAPCPTSQSRLHPHSHPQWQWQWQRHPQPQPPPRPLRGSTTYDNWTGEPRFPAGPTPIPTLSSSDPASRFDARSGGRGGVPRTRYDFEYVDE